MDEITISSFFTNDGQPIATLTPTIRIWEISPGDQTLVIGSVEGTNAPGAPGGDTLGGTVGTDGEMVPVFDDTAGVAGSGGVVGGSQDGFYKFTFNSDNGYDPTKNYLFRVDGGATQMNSERYQIGNINPQMELDVDTLVDAIYDEPRLNHNQAGSVGEAINQDRANLTQLTVSLTDVEALVALLVKYETGRTKIDHANSTLVVYDTDCVTPLRTFQLTDSNGNPSTDEVCERKPLAAGTSDGIGTC